MKYIKRQIEKQVLELNKTWSVIFMTGARQVEKIAMFWGLVKRENARRKYVFLDNLNAREVAKSDLNSHKLSVLIDKVQYAPELFQRIWNGCMPNLISGQVDERNVYYFAYFSAYVGRDIWVISGTVKTPKFVLLIAAAAVCVLQHINYRSIADYVNIDQLTYKNWINILETLGIVFLLYPPSDDEYTTKTSEMSFYDTGFVCYLTGLSSPQATKRGGMSDALIQKFHLSEVITSVFGNSMISILSNGDIKAGWE